MSEMSPEPVDPFVDQDMLPVAKSAHDMFVAFMAAGFAEGQALHIITGVITTILLGSAGHPPVQ